MVKVEVTLKTGQTIIGWLQSQGGGMVSLFNAYFKETPGVLYHISVYDRDVQSIVHLERTFTQLEFGEEEVLGGDVGGYDQFEFAERVHGIKSDFDESVYTTPLDKSSDFYKKNVEVCKQLAREILQDKKGSRHQLEERGAVFSDDEEEALYSSVQCGDSKNKNFTCNSRGKNSGGLALEIHDGDGCSFADSSSFYKTDISSSASNRSTFVSAQTPQKLPHKDGELKSHTRKNGKPEEKDPKVDAKGVKTDVKFSRDLSSERDARKTYSRDRYSVERPPRNGQNSRKTTTKILFPGSSKRDKDVSSEKTKEHDNKKIIHSEVKKCVVAGENRNILKEPVIDKKDVDTSAHKWKINERKAASVGNKNISPGQRGHFHEKKINTKLDCKTDPKNVPGTKEILQKSYTVENKGRLSEEMPVQSRKMPVQSEETPVQSREITGMTEKTTEHKKIEAVKEPEKTPSKPEMRAISVEVKNSGKGPIKTMNDISRCVQAIVASFKNSFETPAGWGDGEHFNESSEGRREKKWTYGQSYNYLNSGRKRN